MIEINAKDLQVGDEFTTLEDQGAVWFKVLEVRRQNMPMDVRGEVVQANPEVAYRVADREWMDLGWFEKVVVR